MSVEVARQVHRLALLAAVAVALLLGEISSRAVSAQTTQYPVTPLVDCVTYKGEVDVLTVHFGYVDPRRERSLDEPALGLSDREALIMRSRNSRGVV